MNYTIPAPIPQGLLPMVPIRDGEVPKRRIKSAAEAQTIVANLWQANLQRNLMFASQQGQIDGNPPYSPGKLRSMGRASSPNVNTLEAKALRSAAMVPFYDLFAGGARYVDIKLAAPGMQSGDAKGYGTPRYNGLGDPESPADPGFDAVKLADLSGVVSEEYDRLLRRWQNFEFTMHQAMTDYVTFGRCHLPWDSQDSWRFRRVAFNRVMVPDGTPIDIEELEVIVLLQNFTVARLYSKIRNEAKAREAGWDIDETMNALSRAVPVDPQIPNDYMATQQMIRDSDIYVSARSSTVQTATIFVKEMSGKWSELMIRRDQIPGTVNATDNASQDARTRDPHYLFAAYERYASPMDIIPSMFFEVTEGTWNGSAGLARDIFSLMQLKDRTFCLQMESLWLRNSVILQPKTELSKDRMNLVQFGAITWLPTNVDVQQSQVLGDIGSTLAISQEMDNMVQRNTGIYRPTMQREGGNPETLGEFNAKFAQATVLSTSAINRFYAQLDRLYAAQLPRVIACGMRSGGSTEYEKEARMFVQRCEARGVSREQLKHIDSIHAFRNIGQGSAAMRQQIMASFMDPVVFTRYPADGQEAILEDFTRIVGSQTAVDRYMPLSARMKLPSDQLELALLENATIRNGAPVTWTPSQNNLIHAQAHLQAGAQAIAAAEQGADPHDITVFVDNIGAHTAIHIQRQQQNPSTKEAMKVLTQQWKQLASLNDKLKAAINAMPKQQQQLAQKQGEVLTDAKVKMLDVQLKNQVSQQKAMATLQLKKQRQDAELALKAQQLNADTAFKAQAAATDAALSDAETAATIQRDVAKTASELALRRAEHAHTLALERQQAAHERAMREKEAESAPESDAS